MKTWYVFMRDDREDDPASPELEDSTLRVWKTDHAYGIGLEIDRAERSDEAELTWLTAEDLHRIGTALVNIAAGISAPDSSS